MLNFEEELKKFTPSMEVDDIEEALYREDLQQQQQAGAQESGRHPEADDRRR